jgi:hypothetical protein
MSVSLSSSATPSPTTAPSAMPGPLEFRLRVKDSYVRGDERPYSVCQGHADSRSQFVQGRNREASDAVASVVDA